MLFKMNFCHVYMKYEILLHADVDMLSIGKLYCYKIKAIFLIANAQSSHNKIDNLQFIFLTLLYIYGINLICCGFFVHFNDRLIRWNIISKQINVLMLFSCPIFGIQHTIPSPYFTFTIEWNSALYK